MDISLLLRTNNNTQPIKAKIAELTLDASLSETHSFTSKVTQFPIENGSIITDHILNDPVKVTIQGLISNNPLPRAGEEVYGSKETTAPLSLSEFNTFKSTFAPMYRAQAAYFDLMDIRNNKQLITIVTGLKSYSNMAMESLSIPRNPQVGDAIEFTADFVQVVLVSNSKVILEAIVSTGTGNVGHTQSKIEASVKNPEPVTSEQELISSYYMKQFKRANGIPLQTRVAP